MHLCKKYVKNMMKEEDLAKHIGWSCKIWRYIRTWSAGVKMENSIKQSPRPPLACLIVKILVQREGMAISIKGNATERERGRADPHIKKEVLRRMKTENKDGGKTKHQKISWWI